MREHLAPRRNRRGRHAPQKRPLLVAIVGALGSLVGIATVVALVLGVYIGGLARTFDLNKDVIVDPFPTGERPSPTGDSKNILLIGSDSRQHLNPDRDRTSGGRADTIMLVHISADRRAVYLVSIMRDSWVEVPGHGRAKINAALSWGGVSLATSTVENLLDVRIDHVAEIDFQGFKGMTDALGGVDVNSSRAFTARGHSFKLGSNHLDGDAALAFVRERYAFADADYERVRNQQAFMRGILNQLIAKNTITSPDRVRAFVAAMSKNLSVDEGLDIQTIVTLAWSLRAIDSRSLTTFTAPSVGTGKSPDGQAIVNLNPLAMRSLSQALRSDQLAEWLQENPQ